MTGKGILLGLVAVAVVIGGVIMLNQSPPEAEAPTNNELNDQNQSAGNNNQAPAQNNSQNSNQAPPTSNETQSQPQPQTTTISFTGSAYSPSNVTINVGDTVIFRNDSTQFMWPASDPHPTHTGLPGFDSVRPLEPGESWAFQFIRAGSFGYHDHMKPNLGGTVTVQ